MGKFNVVKTPIEDLIILEPTIFGDDRGFFMETYNQEEFHELGLDMTFVQDNHSKSKRGVLRGLHFQTKFTQGKLVRAIKGEVFDVAVDLRKSSKTFGKWHGVILSEQNKLQFYVPEGFAHGFLVLSEYAEFVYKCTNLYKPEFDSGILWNDPDINIKWPLDGIDEVLLSEKDRKLQSFKDNKTFF